MPHPCGAIPLRNIIRFSWKFIAVDIWYLQWELQPHRVNGKAGVFYGIVDKRTNQFALGEIKVKWIFGSRPKRIRSRHVIRTRGGVWDFNFLMRNADVAAIATSTIYGWSAQRTTHHSHRLHLLFIIANLRKSTMNEKNEYSTQTMRTNGATRWWKTVC